MPIHERIYARMERRPIKGESSPILALADYNHRYAFKGFFTKFAFWGAFVACAGLGFTVYGIAASEEQLLGRLVVLGFMDSPVDSVDKVGSDVFRNIASNLALIGFNLFGWFALFLTAFVGSGQIANDMRSHAFEVYLARPISSWQYILGKLLTVMRPVFLVTFAPTCILLLIANILVPSSFVPTLSIYPRVALASLFYAWVNASLILGISSMGRSPRYATIFWFIINLGSLGLATTLAFSTEINSYLHIGISFNQITVIKHLLGVDTLSRLSPIETRVLDLSWTRAFLTLAAIACVGLWLAWRRSRAGRLP